MTRVIHSANPAGIETLLNGTEEFDYLCCSSTSCPGFFRNLLFTVEGEILRQFGGDVGAGSLDPEKNMGANTPWDEIHIENGYKVIGIDARSDETLAQIATYIIMYEMELDIRNFDIPEKFQEIDWLEDMEESKFQDLREEWGF